MKIARLDINQADFNYHHLDGLLAWEGVSDKAVNEQVEEIIAAVRERGDAAVVDYTARFDALDVASMADLTLDRARLELALERIHQRLSAASGAEVAAERVRVYHEHQRQESWRYTERPTAPCWVSRSPRWTGWGCICTGRQRRPIRPRY